MAQVRSLNKDMCINKINGHFYLTDKKTSINITNFDGYELIDNGLVIIKKIVKDGISDYLVGSIDYYGKPLNNQNDFYLKNSHEKIYGTNLNTVMANAYDSLGVLSKINKENACKLFSQIGDNQIILFDGKYFIFDPVNKSYLGYFDELTYISYEEKYINGVISIPVEEYGALKVNPYRVNLDFSGNLVKLGDFWKYGIDHWLKGSLNNLSMGYLDNAMELDDNDNPILRANSPLNYVMKKYPYFKVKTNNTYSLK